RPLRRGLLHVQRGDGLDVPLPSGGLGCRVRRRRGGRARRRRLARRQALRRESPWPAALLRKASRRARGGARAAAPARCAAPSLAGLPRRARAPLSRRRPVPGLGRRSGAARVSAVAEYLRLAGATAVVLLPGALIARAAGTRSAAAAFVFGLAAVFAAWAV